MPVSSWSTTASSNATADTANGINWAEGMNPAQVNDSARAMMAVIKADFDNSLANTGYQKFPNGMIVQWGSASMNPVSAGSADHSAPVTFPIAFPTAVRRIIPGGFDAVVSGDPRVLGAISMSGISNTGVTLLARNNISGTTVAANLTWIAVGN